MRLSDDEMVLRVDPPVIPVEDSWAGLLSTTPTEIVRSFSMKANLGNYESVDLFVSQKVPCTLKQAEAVSEKVYEFVKSQVLKSQRKFLEERASKSNGKVVAMDPGDRQGAFRNS